MRRRSKLSAKKRTFSDILTGVAHENAGRLVNKISTADRLAKSLRGRSRERLYPVREQAMANLTMLWPFVPLLDEPSESPVVLATVPRVRLNFSTVMTVRSIARSELAVGA